MALKDSDTPAITADEALRRLMDGNKRFLRGEARFSTVRKEVLAELARQQTPYATVVGCSDSRVPPELLFDAGFGELFVIRVAGNTLSPEVAGSMQYAGIHLNTPLFVILGHEGCGAVSAALETKFEGVWHRSRIAKLVNGIVPALDEINAYFPPARRLRDAKPAPRGRCVMIEAWQRDDWRFLATVQCSWGKCRLKNATRGAIVRSAGPHLVDGGNVFPIGFDFAEKRWLAFLLRHAGGGISDGWSPAPSTAVRPRRRRQRHRESVLQISRILPVLIWHTAPTTFMIPSAARARPSGDWRIC